MNIKEYRKVQNIAKKVHLNLKEFITPEATEYTISERAKELLLYNGISETWYYNVPAYVLLGSRSCLSISGRQYKPSNERVGERNLITVDISPKLGEVWGDCARSYIVENGVVTNKPTSREFVAGVLIEKKLHKKMLKYVTPETKFSELYLYGNELIKNYNYENLDFLSNLGHSIEISPSDRRFIDNTTHEELGSVKFFTFEPHIKRKGGTWGFKQEDIYYFNKQGQAVKL